MEVKHVITLDVDPDYAERLGIPEHAAIAELASKQVQALAVFLESVPKVDIVYDSDNHTLTFQARFEVAD